MEKIEQCSGGDRIQAHVGEQHDRGKEYNFVIPRRTTGRVNLGEKPMMFVRVAVKHEPQQYAIVHRDAMPEVFEEIRGQECEKKNRPFASGDGQCQKRGGDADHGQRTDIDEGQVGDHVGAPSDTR